ncbi:PCSK4 convertase, partial [Indicator maculatus]|nr:PCSK4 convertase [Indicator maculatus]
QVMEGEPYYHFKHRGTRQEALSRHWGWHMRLAKEPKVLWFEQQTLKRRRKRSISVVPTDPWFHKQWYMVRLLGKQQDLCCQAKGKVPGACVELSHPVPRAAGSCGCLFYLLQQDPLASYDFNSNDPDPQPRYTPEDENQHGTRCAGEAAAVANNQICGAGIAYNARVGGVRMLDGPITDVVEAQSLSLQSQHIHIYSASWGPPDDGKTVDGPGVLAAEAFYRGVTKGRGGLGSIFVLASGNGGINYDNCNSDGYSSSIYTVTVGSVLAGGQRPWFSESCSAILTTTYSSVATSQVHIVTTDLHHRCTDQHMGTSASAPLAAGISALALQANPALTWRDLQHLLVRSSRAAHLQAEDWAQNGVGRKVSHYYGYGLLDAGLLVEMAKAWPGTRPQRSCSVRALHTPRHIGSQLTISTDTSSCLGGTKHILSLEHVQVQLSLSYSRRGDLLLALTSPMGTTSTLMTLRPYDTSQQGYKDWTFMSTHFWDENPNGTWTLSLENKGDAYNTAQSCALLPSGLLTSFILHLYGTEEDLRSRHLAAPEPCLQWDGQGACQGEPLGRRAQGWCPLQPASPPCPSAACRGSLFAFQSSCLPYCPPHHYSLPQPAARLCALCHPSCYTCQGPSAHNCTTCPPAHTFQQLTHSCSPL